jgi:TonB family protein
MRYTLLLLAAASIAAAPAQTISGTVYDATGAVVTGARVVLLEDFNKVSETKSAQGGTFSFAELKPATYQVQIKIPYFNIFQQLVPLKANENARVYAVLHVARSDQSLSVTGDPLPGVQPAVGVDAARRLGGKVEGLKRVSGRMPRWPETAKKRGASGTVVLYATVKTDGTIDDIVVLESPDRDLEEEVVEAYKTWRYTPMKLDGQPVESRQLFRIEYRYQ